MKEAIIPDQTVIAEPGIQPGAAVPSAEAPANRLADGVPPVDIVVPL